MKFRVLLLFLFILLLSTLCYSASMTSIKKYINYKEGYTTQITAYVYNRHGSRETFNIGIWGDNWGVLSLDKSEITLDPGDRGPFTLTVNLNKEMGKAYGERRLGVSVGEKPRGDGMFQVSATVRSPIIIYVPYPGKYIEGSLSVPNIRVDEPLDISFKVINRGQEDINSLYVSYEIIDQQNKSLALINTSKIALRKEKEYTFKSTWNSEDHLPAPYKVKATAYYDNNNTLKLSREFYIGDLKMEILEASEELHLGTINPFTVSVQSKWNDDIDPVFTKTRFIDIDGNELAEVVSPHYSFRSWQKKDLTSYVDTSNFDLGIYNAEVTLVYASKREKKTFQVEIVKKPPETPIMVEQPKESIFTLSNLIMLLILLLIILNTLWLFFMARKRKKRD
mgnify:CR=1 FL=1